MIGLGCMRLSTRAPHADATAVAVIHAALDAGVTLLDTADAYALTECDVGHNERLVAAALGSWQGDRARITIATKGGLRRPGGRWVPDGRAKHLRDACHASRARLAVDTIDLYQLHVVDPNVPLETSVRALAGLRSEGVVRRIGLCNVNVSQIETARALTDIAAVQVSMSVLDDENLRNGVAEYCREHGILLLAHRPLGGDRSSRIARDPGLNDIAVRRGVTPHIVALAWLRDLAANVVPLAGATRVETARSLAAVLDTELSDTERAALDARFSAGRVLRVPRSERRPHANAAGEVVLIMGMPGAGKSSAADELVRQGYARLNRDEQGGRVSDLIARLEQGIEAGGREWVLDNTYPTRSARNAVIETAWRHGVRARCIHVATPLPDAQINAVNRMLDAHGRLPMPAELRTLGKRDPRFFGPDAQFRYERQLERPVLDEGFETIETRAFTRYEQPSFTNRAIVLEFDGVLCTSRTGRATVLEPDDVVLADERAELLRRAAGDGWILAATAWRPFPGDGSTSAEQVRQCFDRVQELLGVPIDIDSCAHPAGPPVCWCRKPLPGLLLQFAHRHRVALERSILIGRSSADRTLAQRLRMRYEAADVVNL